MVQKISNGIHGNTAGIHGSCPSKLMSILTAVDVIAFSELFVDLNRSKRCRTKTNPSSHFGTQECFVRLKFDSFGSTSLSEFGSPSEFGSSSLFLCATIKAYMQGSREEKAGNRNWVSSFYGDYIQSSHVSYRRVRERAASASSECVR